MAAVLLEEVLVWRCDGFRVDSPDGRLGLVEEVWLGTAGEPVALAVRLENGRRGLMLAEDVRTILEDDRVVIAAPRAKLLELDAPRLEQISAGGGAPRLAASWATTGALLRPPPRPQPLARLLFAVTRSPASQPAAEHERPIWRTILILYASIALLAAGLMAVAFLAALLATGHAY
jgi:hypothetical protein